MCKFEFSSTLWVHLVEVEFGRRVNGKGGMFGWSEKEERNWWARDWGENTNENRSYNFRWNCLAHSKLFYLCAYPFLFCLFFFISYQVIIPFCVCMCVFFIKNLFMCLSLLLVFFYIIIIFFIFFPSVRSSFLFSTDFFFFFFFWEKIFQFLNFLCFIFLVEWSAHSYTIF